MHSLLRASVSSAGLRRWLLLLVASFPIVSAQAQSDSFTIVALPDTQIYSRQYPHIFRAQTQWIANNVSNLNIKLVVGLGDIVDNGSDLAQWQNATGAISLLQGRVPYMLAIGNHDYDSNKPNSRSAVYYNTFYGVSHYAGQPWFGGSFPAGTTENFYGTFVFNGQKYLIMMLEFYPRASAIAWASSVIQANRDKKVIMVTHAYEFDDNTRVQTCYSDSAGTYGLTADNDGEEMWRKLASQHVNVIMVLSGHIKVNDGVGRRADLGVKGNLVNQVLSDYQAYANGGDGKLRLIKISPSENKVQVSTYSPFSNTWLTDSQNQFTLDLLNPGATGGGTATISGTVKSVVDCSRLPGVAVSYAGRSATTDANGNFTLSVPTTRKYSSTTLTAQRNGWGQVQHAVTAQTGSNNKLTVFMSTSGRLTGRVTNALGTSISGATVKMVGGKLETTKIVTTDAAGNYASGWIPVGNYTVTVSAASHATKSTSTTVSTGVTRAVNVSLQ